MAIYFRIFSHSFCYRFLQLLLQIISTNLLSCPFYPSIIFFSIILILFFNLIYFGKYKKKRFFVYCFFDFRFSDFVGKMKLLTKFKEIKLFKRRFNFNVIATFKQIIFFSPIILIFGYLIFRNDLFVLFNNFEPFLMDGRVKESGKLIAFLNCCPQIFIHTNSCYYVV